METVYDHTKSVLAIFDQYEQEDRQSLKEFESAFSDVFKKFDIKLPLEKSSTRGTKKPKISEIEEDSGVDATTTTNTTESSQYSSDNVRPSRSAKTKASANLKLPNLGTKLRREIKMEPIVENDHNSTHSTKSVTNENEIDSVAVKREKISVGIRSEANTSADKDLSVLVIPNEINIITLSDDENVNDEEIMPPPLLPAPKKLAAKKTRKARNDNQSEIDNGSTVSSSENVTTSVKSLKSTKTKKASKKTKKPLIPFVEVKEEEEEPILAQQSPQMETSQKDIQDANVNQISSNGTMESVYEDANDKVQKSSQSSNALPVCSTYVCKPAAAAKVVDDTFVSSNSTFSVGNSEQNGNTVDVAGAAAKTSYSSLITEDNSEEEIISPVVPMNLKQKKELFNPCVQSPIHMKVAAFERQAQMLFSPVPTRQTRTKTRQLAKENVDAGVSKLPKPTTPSVESRYLHTPVNQMLMLTKASSQNVVRTQSSVPKPGSRPMTVQPLKNRSRDNSVEDLARAREAIQEEKKKKAEERLKRVQQQREAREKEKQDKYLKALQEKEEREQARKLQREQLKAQELEKKQRLKAELAKATKLERDLMTKKMLANEMNQNKLEENELNFDMLHTDDSTDEEEKPSKNRPAPPAWSLSSNRKANLIVQAGIDPSIIDTFFSCQPTTPDLAAIFPQIDSKHLKRNSSAFWNTPPRYSTLPKY